MSKYKSKNVTIVGFGVSGVAAAKYMAKQGAKVTVTDQKQKPELAESLKACADLKIEFDLGKHSPKSFLTAETIVVSPGVPLNQQFLTEAKQKNIPIISEIELAAQHIKEPLIAVTGTNGKTTTVTLIGEMFKADNRNPFVGGNSGNPLLNYVLNKNDHGVVVAELSSFQLELCEKMVPAVAVFTNIDQDHLDRYGDMQAYVDAKKRLLKVCDRNTYVVLNYEDPYVSRFNEETLGKVIWYLKRDPMEIGGTFAEGFLGAYFKPGATQIQVRLSGRQESYDITKFKLFGDHNRENLMAAICAARLQGVSSQAIQKVIDTFPGVAHRLEFVRKKDGVYFINDSKATNVGSVIKSLEAFKKNPIVLISGGKDKDSDFSPLADLVRKRVKLLVLLGEAKEKMNRALGDYTETYMVGTFDEAILLAYQKSRTGDIILLAPGCASYDMFRNYEERGDYFKKLVHQL